MLERNHHWLSFPQKKQKQNKKKNQTSTDNWVEQNKCNPDPIWRMNFQRPLLLHPLQNQVAEDVDSVPLGTFGVGGGQKCDSFFDFLDFWFFQRYPLLHALQKYFEGVDNVDGIPPGTFLGGNLKKNEKSLSFCFFRFFFGFWFSNKINNCCEE